MILNRVYFVVALFCVTIAISMLYAGVVVFSVGRIFVLEGIGETVARLMVFVVVASVNLRYVFPAELAEKFNWRIKTKVPNSVLYLSRFLSSLFVTEVAFMALGDALDLSAVGAVFFWFAVLLTTYYMLTFAARSAD